MAKVKGWHFISETVLTPNDGREQFVLPDRVLTVERTHGIARLILMGTGLLVMMSLGSIASVIGIIAAFFAWLGFIYLVQKLLTKKMQKRLHPICYVDRDNVGDYYIAMDMDTYDFYLIHHIFPDPDDDNPATYIGFEPMKFWDCRSILCDKGERIKAVIEDIRYENRQDYLRYQFGESEFRWVRFLHQKEGEMHKLACARIDRSNSVQVRYLLLTDADYQGLFAGCETAYEMYKTFLSETLDSVNGLLSRTLSNEEARVFHSYYNGNGERSETVLDIYFNKNYSCEFCSQKEGLVGDLAVIEFLEGLPSSLSDSSDAPEPIYAE